MAIVGTAPGWRQQEDPWWDCWVSYLGRERDQARPGAAAGILWAGAVAGGAGGLPGVPLVQAAALLPQAAQKVLCLHQDRDSSEFSWFTVH